MAQRDRPVIVRAIGHQVEERARSLAVALVALEKGIAIYSGRLDRLNSHERSDAIIGHSGRPGSLLDSLGRRWHRRRPGWTLTLSATSPTSEPSQPAAGFRDLPRLRRLYGK